MEDINCWESKFKPCVYSARLLSKVASLNEQAKDKVDVTEIKKAIYYAKKYHAGQIRESSGEPYYSHPIEVAYIVSDYLFRTDILVTSILHDIVEDSKLTVENIEAIFCSKIAEQVEDLTRIKKDGKISAGKMVELLWHQGKYEILLIKEIDRWHNMQTVSAKSPEKIVKTVDETMATFVPLAAYLGTRKVLKGLLKTCRQQAKRQVTESAEAVSKVLASLDI